MNKPPHSQTMIPGRVACLLLVGLLTAAGPTTFASGRSIASLDSSLEVLGLVKIEAKRPGPDFALSDTSGKAVRLADLRGKVVFLTFWTTY